MFGVLGPPSNKFLLVCFGFVLRPLVSCWSVLFAWKKKNGEEEPYHQTFVARTMTYKLNEIKSIPRASRVKPFPDWHSGCEFTPELMRQLTNDTGSKLFL